MLAIKHHETTVRWGGTGQVLHEVGTPGAHGGNAFPPCMLAASTQTCNPEMESADRLLNKVMHDVRPWGRRAKSHPAVVKPATVKKGPPPQRATASRGSLATPTGPLPTNKAGTELHVLFVLLLSCVTTYVVYMTLCTLQAQCLCWALCPT